MPKFKQLADDLREYVTKVQAREITWLSYSYGKVNESGKFCGCVLGYIGLKYDKRTDNPVNTVFKYHDIDLHDTKYDDGTDSGYCGMSLFYVITKRSDLNYLDLLPLADRIENMETQDGR